MKSLAAVNVYFRPETTVVEGAALAAQLGCVLVYRGSGFFLRRKPRSTGYYAPRPSHFSLPALPRST